MQWARATFSSAGRSGGNGESNRQAAFFHSLENGFVAKFKDILPGKTKGLLPGET
jgi:hypothetical protein